MLATRAKPETRPQQPTETAVYWEEFKRLEVVAKDAPWLRSMRKAGIARFAELGFPTVHDEDWRFTNVAPIVKLPFKPVLEPPRDGVSAEALEEFTFAEIPSHKLVFVNGHFVPDLSVRPNLPDGVNLISLAMALDSHPALVEKQLLRFARAEANSFAALNSAFFRDGAFVYVPAGIMVSEPVQLLFICTATEAGTTAHPRNVIIAEEGSQLTVLESYVSLTDAASFTNAVTQLDVGGNAIVEHLKFQDESQQAFHIATVAAHFGRASNVVTHSIAFGGRLSRTNIYATLAGAGLECILNGLYLTQHEQLLDHYMMVDHAQPHCTSHEYFNGILADRSKAVFHGRILVRPGAQKTDAKQTNKNLLLSDDATVDTKPQLEIYADDVKCTHGATVGQLSDEAIFYLRTRGIGIEAARRMLIHGFASEIISRIRCAAVRQELDELVWERLEQHEQLGAKK